MIDWLKKKMAIIALATSNVEKKSLNDVIDVTESNVSMNQRMNQGSLMDSLINGEITQEVKNLRWRQYKILNELEEKRMTLNKNHFSKLDIYKSDENELNFVINVEERYKNFHESVSDMSETSENNDKLFKLKENIKIEDEFLNIEYKSKTKYNIVKYLNKIFIRDLEDGKKLIELFVYKSPLTDNATKNLLISDLNRTITNRAFGTFIDFNKISFITNNDLGVKNGLAYEYENIELIEVVDFKGSLIIRVKGDVLVDGLNLYEKYRESELDNKYKNKIKKG